MNGDFAPEPMLQEDKSRFVLFPIKQPDVWYYIIILYYILLYSNIYIIFY